MTEDSRPMRAGKDGPFFLVMAIALTAIFIAGFVPIYLAIVFSPRTLPVWVHLHGAVMATWVLLFAVQVALIRGGGIALHRRLGLLSLALMVVLVPLGSATNILSIRRGAIPPFFTAADLFAVDQLDLVVFVSLYAWAMVQRRSPAWHKRLMLCAMIMLTYPAIARFALRQLHVAVPLIVPVSVSFVLLLAVIGPIHDLVRYRRVHPAFAWGAAIIFLAQPGHALVAASPLVQSLVHTLSASHPAGQ